MPKKRRRLKISLAVKCQLLFGAAVVLIIAAALYVPWRRMQQLTSQLNEKAAGAVATNLIAEHVEEMTTRQASLPTTSPSQPQSQPIVQDGYPFAPPRIISTAKLLQASPGFSRFDRSAYGHLLGDRERTFYSQDFFIKDGAWGYSRFAKPFAAGYPAMMHPMPHQQRERGGGHVTPIFRLPFSGHPTPAPTRLPLLGIVTSVLQIPSQVESSQILLNHIFILTAGLVAGTLAIIIFYLITTRLILQPVRVLQETA